MVVQWNKVTWYSKILAVILFVAVFYVGFNLGQQKKEVDTKTPTTEAPATVKTLPPEITVKEQSIKEENFTGKIAAITGTSTLAKAAQNFIQKEVSDFKKQADTDVPKIRERFGADAPPTHYEIDIGAKFLQADKTESVVITIYTYTGGANGNDAYKVITVSHKSGSNQESILTLSSIIKSGERDAFMNTLRKTLNDWRPEGSSTSPLFPDSVEGLKFADLTNWSLDSKNLTIYFDKYSIGPGALGAVPFPVPLTKLRDYLSSNYSL